MGTTNMIDLSEESLPVVQAMMTFLCGGALTAKDVKSDNHSQLNFWVDLHSPSTPNHDQETHRAGCRKLPLPSHKLLDIRSVLRYLSRDLLKTAQLHSGTTRSDLHCLCRTPRRSQQENRLCGLAAGHTSIGD